MLPSMKRRMTLDEVLLVRTVMFFLNLPGNLPLPLYTTSILPFAPGAMGSLEYSGTVQPHVVRA